MKRLLFGCCVIGLLVAGAVAAAEESPREQWPEFRGPHGNGHSSATGLPTRWSETENVKWKSPVRGKAWSSPVVWDDQIWVATAPPDGKELFALAFDANTGEALHDIKVFDIEKPQFVIERNSYASCTPAIEAGRVYVHFGAHGTACLDTATGKRLWSRQDLECDHHRGPASSPILWENLLILTFDGFDKQYLAALDKETGETVWRTDRKFNYGTDDGDAKKAYSTPQVAVVDGEPQLISPSAGCTAAYDPRSGTELWRVKSGGMNASCRPVVVNNLAISGTADQGFNLFAVKLGGTGDVTGSHVEWKLSKGAPRYSSPIAVDDLLYMGSEQGVLTCVEAATAKPVWQERLGGLFMPSPLYADGKLYFFNEEGQTFVVEPGRKFKLLATSELPGGFMASPAVHGQGLILRTKDALYRIEASDSR
jgi:outer membrane protein assembly factor BamB